MTRIVVIITEDGFFDTVLGDSEANVTVLQRGLHDREIDKAESELSEYEDTEPPTTL